MNTTTDSTKTLEEMTIPELIAAMNELDGFYTTSFQMQDTAGMESIKNHYNTIGTELYNRMGQKFSPVA